MLEGVTPGVGWHAWAPLLAACNLAAAALVVPVLMSWARQGDRRRLARSAAISVLAVTTVYAVLVRPSDIPREWVTIIHEGLGYKSILHLYMSGVHAGINFPFVIASIAEGPVANLHDAVWFNLLLAAINALIFLHVGLYVTTPVWAVVWTAVFALNPVMFLAAFSELPTHLLGLYFMIGVLAWAVLTEPLAHGRGARAAALALGALVTLLIGLTRPEVSVIGVVALAVYVADALLPPRWWSRLAGMLGDRARSLLAFLARHPAAVAALCLVSLYLTQSGLPWGLGGRSEWAALYPFNPALYSLFFYLPMLLLPVGVSFAILFGFIYAARHFRLFAGLALSLFLLVRMYFAAQNQFYEAGRYLSYVLPGVFLLGLFGKRQFDALAGRLRPNWYRLAAVLYIMAWFTRALPGTPDLFLRPEYHRDGGFAQVLLDLNMQREVRHLLATVEENPQCVFIGRVIENHAQPDAPPAYAYAVFGVPVPAPIFVSEGKATVDQVVARYAPNAACVRLYFGGDCNVRKGDGCTQFIAGRKLIHEDRYWSRLYNNPPDFSYAAPEIVLATYAYP